MFKEMFTNIAEGIITPENLNVKTSDIDKLSKMYNKFDIFFEPNPAPADNVTGNFDPRTKEINIQVPPKANLNMLNSVLSHELLHREQDKRSNGNYGEWVVKFGTKLNDYIAKFNDRVDAETSTQAEYDKILKMQNTFKLGNSWELMAYAYQFVKVRKEIKAKSADDVVKFISSITDIPINNKMKKYIGMYWLIREKL